MTSSQPTPPLGHWFLRLAALLDPRCAARFARLLLGALLARGRRTAKPHYAYLYLQPLTCFGPNHLRAQAEGPSARRSDTPPQHESTRSVMG